MAYRWLIAVMIFTSNCVNYMLRVNISVNLVAMVPVSNSTQSVSQVVLDWTPYERGYILSGYSWGYLVANVLCGPPAAERWGPRRVIFCITIVGAVLTLLSPNAAKHSFGMMLAVRILIGFFAGFYFPSNYSLIGKWAVPNERGTFLGALIGGSIGTFITWSLCGIIIERYGWEWGFYTFGIFALLWTAVWWLSVYDSPEVHPRISEAEKKYIYEGSKQSKKERVTTPIRRMLTSVPVLSLCVLNFGTGWGIYLIMTAAPNYLANALGFSISSTGLLSAMIYLLRSSSAFVFGSIGDFLLKKKLVRLKLLRKCGCFISHIVPGLLLLGLAMPGLSTTFYLATIMTAMMMNGSVTLSSAANAYDLTRDHIALLSGLITSCTTVAGIISPLVTAHFTKYNEVNVDAWQPVFYVASAVLVVSGLQFVVFGSTETQPWNEVKPQEKMIYGHST